MPPKGSTLPEGSMLPGFSTATAVPEVVMPLAVTEMASYPAVPKVKMPDADTEVSTTADT